MAQRPSMTFTRDGKLWRALIAACCLAACGQNEPLQPPDPTDPAGIFFDPGRVIEVSVEMDASSWDTLRLQSRDLFEILAGDCLAKPFRSPFTFFPARVTVDGIRRDNVGIRKKGFLGSLDDNKPSLRIKFDEYQPSGDLYGLTRVTLNNSRQDPSYLRQCLAYKVFADAGVPAPRCNFAHVTVNGADLGLYVHVESVDKDFLARHFDDEDGNLYEGTLSDFRTEWVKTFDRKTNETDQDRSDLQSVVKAVEETVSDATLLDGIERVVDVERFLDFWSAEVLLGHWDGYANNTNNFFVYRDASSKKFAFIPWGTDGVLLADPFAGAEPRPTSVYARGALARRLYLHPRTRGRYLERLRAHLARVWDEKALLAEIDRMDALITPVVLRATRIGDHRRAIQEVREFVSRRRNEIMTELGRGEPVWDEPLRKPLCLTIVGLLDASFSTTFGTLDSPNPFQAGTGRISGTLNGAPVQPRLVGAIAGLDPESPPERPRAVVVLIGLLPDGSAIAVFVVTEAFRFTSGAVVPLDWGSAFGAVFRFGGGGGQPTLIGYLLNGTLSFDRAETTPAAPVAGRFRAQVVSF